MKKILTFAFCMVSVAAFADATQMTASAGEVGVLTVTTTQKNFVIAAAFDNLDGSSLTLDKLVKTTNMAAGDLLYVFDNGVFKGWSFDAETKSWEPLLDVTATRSGVNFADGTSADEQRCAYGSGIWFQRAGDEDVAVKLTVYGKPLENPGLFVVPAGATCLLANPTASAKAPTILDSNTGDMVKLPSDALIQEVYRYNGTDWVGGTDPITHLPKTGFPTIPAGSGFWYKSAKDAVTVTW